MTTANPAALLALQRWSARKIVKTCPVCGETFLGDKAQIYCCRKHQWLAAGRRRRAARTVDELVSTDIHSRPEVHAYGAD